MLGWCPWRKKPDPTPVQILRLQMVKAQHELIDHTALREFYESTTNMLTARIARIRQDIKAMDNDNQGTPS